MDRSGLVHELGLELLEVEEEEAAAVGLQHLLRIVPGDLAGEVTADAATGVRAVEWPEPLAGTTAAGPPDVLASNPALPHILRHGFLEAARVEELVSLEEWRANPMQRELFAPRGVPYALVTGHLDDAGALRGWGVNRSRPFTEEERLLLAAFEPFLRVGVVVRRTRRLVADLHHAVAGGEGLVIVRRGVVSYVNDLARELMRRHRTSWDRLSKPAALLSGRRRSGTVVTPRGSLRLRWRPAQPGTVVVVLEEAQHERAPVAGDDVVLSPRQLEVLQLLVEGNTAVSTGRRLGISERTVHKHLQNTYRLLGVGDRMSAARRARDLGLLP